ncbi:MULTISPECIES: hypothetical protein [Microbacterium]|uniref:Uncharacterized protein n=1 Tax=Microbacterium paraoxydans TaxID=199592 RepID=A0A1H1MTY1_9MICO|nr:MULTISPECIES: hypothetical protein [Microbacterium]AVL97373.1 hypothetical protein C6C15_09835 [Microbacterium sp. str. 'China']MCK2031934.1 hypothetical protein [Microbacterium sp. KSW4-4]MCT2223569.1 hypothetical protein [Microbacterium paraoxydans]SDR90156.1 hypothetical protein SAMN04489809_0620 [Microbacterium paraoxydans]
MKNKIRAGVLALGVAAVMVLGSGVSAGAVVKPIPQGDGGGGKMGTKTCFIGGMRAICLK